MTASPPPRSVPPNRRGVLLSAAALAFSGLGARAALAAESGDILDQVRGYGALRPDPAGVLDLPAGFSYQVVSRAGEVMDDGFLAPDNFDGMGCLALPDGRLALMRNHELDEGEHRLGPTGGRADLEAKLGALPAFDRSADGRVLPGGVTTLIVDPATGRRERQFLSLAGTAVNCAGGSTPWGTWLTCEETMLSAPKTGTSHGWIFEVPADAPGPVVPVPLTAMGRFRHEAAAVDPATGTVYLTEDRDDGLLYRFLPNSPGRLTGGGRLQALAFEAGGSDSRNWRRTDLTVGEVRAVRWIDLDEVESPKDDLRRRGHSAGGVLFARGEGVHLAARPDGGCDIFFTCTSGGDRRLGQIFRLTSQPKTGADQLQLFLESRDSRVMDYADNVTIAPSGHLVICEDRVGLSLNHLKVVTPAGKVCALARLRMRTELAGACFSPDGRFLFVNAYAPGRTFAIEGPWTTFSEAPA
jgi:secreted PhoX family phosphatase